MVGMPAQGPLVDVVQLAAGARARALITLAVLKEVLLAMPHLHRDGAVVPRRDEGQPPHNGGDGDNVDDGPRLGLVQLLHSAACACVCMHVHVRARARSCFCACACARASSATSHPPPHIPPPPPVLLHTGSVVAAEGQ